MRVLVIETDRSIVTGINNYSEIVNVSAVKFKYKSDLRIMIKSMEIMLIFFGIVIHTANVVNLARRESVQFVLAS